MDGFKKKKGSKIQKVKIGRVEYKIIICSELISASESILGLCDHSSKIIYVVDNGDKNLLKENLIHELCHAVICEACLRYSESWSMEVEEILVESIARDLAPLIKF